MGAGRGPTTLSFEIQAETADDPPLQGARLTRGEEIIYETLDGFAVQREERVFTASLLLATY